MNTVARRTFDASLPVVSQLVRFSVVGASGYVANLVAYTVAVHVLETPYGLAATVAFLIAVGNNYALNRRWTFPQSDRASHLEAGRFFVVSVASFAVGAGLLAGQVESGVPKVPAQAIALLTVAPLSFALHRHWTFRKGLRGGLSVRIPWPLAVALASVLAVSARLIYINMPLSADEGGFGEVARLWRNGATLYDGAWADRPQGLLLVFRGVLAIDDSELALRVAAIVASVVLLVLFAGLARRLVGRHAALIAVFLLATGGASPFIEAYTLSGELLASALSVGSLFAFVVYLERRHTALILLAGLLTGCAVMVKQSGFDAGVAALAYLIWTERRAALRPALMLLAGALVAPFLCIVSAPDFGNWWHAVVAYRFEGDSLFRGGVAYRLMLFFNGIRSAALALAVPLVLLPGGWRIAPRLVKLWFVAGLIGVLGGGNFWAHYWIQIVPPLCLIAAPRLAQLLRQREMRRPLRVVPVLAAAIVSVAISTVPLTRGTEGRVEAFTQGDTVRLYDEEIAAYVRTHTSPNDRILVTPLAGGSIYFLADRRPAYRFLWYRPAKSMSGGVEDLRRVVAEKRASLVVVLADPAVLDPSGKTTALLKRDYRVVRRVGPTAILAPA